MYMDLTLFNTQNRHMILTNDAAVQSIHLNINLLNTFFFLTIVLQGLFNDVIIFINFYDTKLYLIFQSSFSKTYALVNLHP